MGLFFWGKKIFLNYINDAKLSISAKDRGLDFAPEMVFEIQFYQKYHDQLGTKLRRIDVIE